MEILSEDQVTEILETLEHQFDSHAFIFEFMRRFPRIYVQRLYNYVDSNDPIRVFHAEIGKFLKQRSDIIALGKTSSANVRGLPSVNENWRKK